MPLGNQWQRPVQGKRSQRWSKLSHPNREDGTSEDSPEEAEGELGVQHMVDPKETEEDLEVEQILGLYTSQ